MSTQLHTFITNVLAMPHYANDSVGSGSKHDSHEDALAIELQKVGYTEIFQEGTRLTRPSKKNPIGRMVKTRTFPNLGRDAVKKAIKSSNPQQELSKLVPGMPAGTFIRQPCNSKAFPDFLVKDFSGTIVLIEAKSGNGVAPAWNDSLVKRDAIYIFSSGTYNSSTVFLGQDVLDQEREDFLSARYQFIREYVTETQTMLSSMPDPYERGFGLNYARPKFEQGGGNKKTDYFKHLDRARCEKNVLDFAIKQ